MPTSHTAALAAAAFITWGATAAAQPTGEELVATRLTTGLTGVTPGSEFELGIVFQIEPGWHIYWNGLSDTGAPPTVTLNLPTGFTAGPIRWPAPKRYRLPGDMLDYIYEDRVALLVPIRVAEDVAAGESFTISADLDWLVCKDSCIPGSAAAFVSIPVLANGTEPRRTEHWTILEESRKRLPRPATEADGVRAAVLGETLSIDVPGATELLVFPGEDSVPLARPIAEGHVQGEQLRAAIQLPRGSASAPTRFRGVVEVRGEEGQPPRFFTLDLPVGT